MKRRLLSLITKIAIFIACLLFVQPDGFSQDRGARSKKTGGGSIKRNKGLKSSYSSRKRSGKRHWNNQDKETRKRMKRAARNAKRRQQGKPMKNNRLV